jgi:hypothetical protein
MLCIYAIEYEYEFGDIVAQAKAELSEQRRDAGGGASTEMTVEREQT